MHVHPALALPIAVLALSLAAFSQAFAADAGDLRKARLKGRIAECVRCDLSGAQFKEGFFQFANFYQSDLTGTLWDGANLAGSTLQETKLANASFVFTNLSGARLEGTDATGANFRNAWLNWAWFANAKLDGADFTGAKMRGAQLYNTDLSKVIGLTQRQIDLACGDSTTKTPPGIRVPACIGF